MLPRGDGQAQVKDDVALQGGRKSDQDRTRCAQSYQDAERVEPAQAFAIPEVSAATLEALEAEFVGVWRVRVRRILAERRP